MQQAVHDAAAHALQAVHAVRAAEPERPARADLDTHLDGVRAGRREAGPHSARSMWMSIRKLRVPTIGSASARRRTTARETRRPATPRTIASVAAPATKPVAAAAAAWTTAGL